MDDAEKWFGSGQNGRAIQHPGGKVRGEESGMGTWDNVRNGRETMW